MNGKVAVGKSNLQQMDECNPQRLREVVNAAKVTQSKKSRGSYEEPCSLTSWKDIAYKSTAINK